MKILDCTIRDGGHLNQWKFDPKIVKAAYFAALNSGVDYFEMGYRFPHSKTGLGSFGYCDDDFLLSLFKPSDECKLAMMVDAGKVDEDIIRPYNPQITPIRAIRVAAYPYEYEKAFRLIRNFKEKNYEVFFQLMAFSMIEPEQFEELKAWNEKNIIEAIYFADSFGSFIPADIETYYDKLKSIGFEKIGFHSHNNLQMAFANSLKAIEIGIEYLDASIYGMGRGSGNLPIELIVGHLEKQGISKYNVVPYLDVIDKYFLKFSDEIRWGYSLESLMGGFANIHPYYPKTLLKDHLYTIDEAWNALQMVQKKCPISFSEDKLDDTLRNRFFTPLTEKKVQKICAEISHEIHTIPAPDAVKIDSFKFTNKFKGRSFLIISTGPSIIENQENINNFIEANNCVVVGVNNLNKLFTTDFHVFVSRKRFEQYSLNVSEESLILIPSFFGMNIVHDDIKNRTEYFNIIAPSENGETPIIDSTLYCNTLNVSVAAILLSYLMGAEQIHCVGMDGYIDEYDKNMVYFYDENNKIDDKETASFRYEMLTKELERINTFLQGQSIPFFIHTPTSHKKYYRSFSSELCLQ